jgi:hypothetical protein
LFLFDNKSLKNKQKTPRLVSLEFGIILTGIPELSRSPFNSNTMQSTKSFTNTQAYLDCARGSKTALLKPVFTWSKTNLQNFPLATKLNCFFYGRGTADNGLHMACGGF